MTTRNLTIGLLLTTLTGAGLACGDSKDDAPPDSGDSFVRRDSGADDEEEDAGPDEEGDAGVSKDAGEEDTLTASEQEAKAKGWAVGCYKKSTKNQELLNSCAAGFRVFDESLYPADWKKGGALPTLP